MIPAVLSKDVLPNRLPCKLGTSFTHCQEPALVTYRMSCATGITLLLNTDFPLSSLNLLLGTWTGSICIVLYLNSFRKLDFSIIKPPQTT